MDLTREAARFKAAGGLSFADCFGVALAHRRGSAILTGDPEFRSVAHQVEVDWLAGP